MSHDQFLIILRSLNVSHNDNSVTDMLHKEQNIINYFNNMMLNSYTPRIELPLDEVMLLWLGHFFKQISVFKQYYNQAPQTWY